AALAGGRASRIDGNTGARSRRAGQCRTRARADRKYPARKFESARRSARALAIDRGVWIDARRRREGGGTLTQRRVESLAPDRAPETRTGLSFGGPIGYVPRARVAGATRVAATVCGDARRQRAIVSARHRALGARIAQSDEASRAAR